MSAPRRPRLPLKPLLRAYAAAPLPSFEDLCSLPWLGPRLAAVLGARSGLLAEAFLDGASTAEFAMTLVAFYEAVVRPPLHADTIHRRAGLVRHALAHLVRSPEPLAQKATRCLAADGPYRVAGLGLSFWSALLQALDPQRRTGPTPLTLAGLRALGLARTPPHAASADVYAAALDAGTRLRAEEPRLSGLHIDHFLSLVALMRGRDLWSGVERLDRVGDGVDLDALVRQERARLPLRRRLRDRGRALEQARRELEAALATQDGPRLGGALSVADPAGVRRAPLDWLAHAETLTLWIGRLWEADDPYEILERFWTRAPIPGAGLWLPAAVLHLRDAHRYLPWSEEVRRGHARLDDAADRADPPAERYRHANAAAQSLAEQRRLHPLEVPGLLAACAAERPTRPRPEDVGSFGGFCADTFAFLRELSEHNHPEWLDGQRDRYRFAVRRPLVELCRALAERYVEPVLRRAHGWTLPSAPRDALTRLRGNGFSRPSPYRTELWIAFRRDDAAFFVRLSATGLRYGLSVGREAGRRLRRVVQEEGETLFRALCTSGAAGDCLFAADDAIGRPIADAAALRAWAAGKTFSAFKDLQSNHPLLASDDLVGDILLTFDRLLPAFASAVADDPLPFLVGRGAAPESADASDADFHRATHLDDAWLERARELLELKRQLILQGVPGTGKTHVARCLARLLTRGRPDAVRLVQFHPAYSYEEFVEGIKVKSVEANGRQDVIYPVEDGVLCAFAAEAARRPAEPFVLVVDEINRGNLPRVFGELLYLLEYREQSVVLPYSRRAFRLPKNLYLVATMNAADRSIAPVDRALRRRFSFLEMPPDGRVLASWLREHPPTDGPAFAATVVALFERLNDRLRTDLGASFQIGHSYFMAERLDRERLGVVWQHHVRPLLEDAFAGQPGRLAGYDPERLLKPSRVPVS